MTDVGVAIIINQAGKVLIAKRKQGRVMEGCWEFPGGKREMEESVEDCVIRELKEEMDIEVSVETPIADIHYNYPWGDVHLIALHTVIRQGSIKLLDHDEMAWVNIDDMDQYGMTPADEPLIKAIREWMAQQDFLFSVDRENKSSYNECKQTEDVSTRE